MLNHATRFNWHAHQGLLRPSILGRATGRGAYALRNKAIEDGDTDEAVPSRATHDEIRAYLDAWRAGDHRGQADALNKVAQYWRADNAAGGMPVHAHPPFPKEFAVTVARLLSEGDDAQQQEQFHGVVARLGPSIRTLVAQQLAALMEQSPERGNGRLENDGWNGTETGNVVESIPSRESRQGSGHMTALEQELATLRGTRNYKGLSQLAEGEGERDPGTVEARDQRGAFRTTEYGPLDRNNFETLPYDPRGDQVRFQELRSPKVIQGIWSWAKKKGLESAAGGALSVLAEWHANRLKSRPGEGPEVGDYLLAFITGAITGGWDPKRGKAELDAALAFGSSLLGDTMYQSAERPISVPKALGAGFSAWIVTKTGGKFRVVSQAVAKYGKKYLEKFIKDFLVAMVGDSLELTKAELQQFWHGVQEYWREQYDEFIYLDDTSPLPADIR